MPRKRVEATAEGAAPDAASAEPIAPRRSGRNAGKDKPAPAPPAPKAPRKKRAVKEAEGEEEHQEEPAPKKAKPDSKPAEEPAKPESKAAGSKPASKAAGSKPPSKAVAKPASSKGKPASSKPKSTSKAGAAPKSTEDAAKKPDTIAEEKEDVEMADKENQEKAAEAPAKPDTAKELQVGDTLPDLTLKSEKDEDIQIAELAKEKGVVLFLVPKADTPGCTTQACGFRDNYGEFDNLGYAVYCLSADPPSAQSKWQTKKDLQYHLISDPKRELITALGAGAGGKTKRSHLVFEKGTGKLIEKKLGVKPADSPTQALEFVKKHASA